MLRLPHFLDCQHMKVARLLALCTGCLFTLNTLLVPISVRGWVNRAIMWLVGLSQWKNPMTPSGIEPTTFELVAQHLNQLCHHVYQELYVTNNETVTEIWSSPGSRDSDCDLLVWHPVTTATKVLKEPVASTFRVISSYLKLEVACSFKKLVITQQNTHCLNLEDHTPNKAKLLANIPVL